MSMSTIFEIAGMFLIPLIAVVIPVLIGRSYGTLQRQKHEEASQESVGAVVTAGFGLLAFMLAFTFQIAINRWDARRTLLLEEVTNIRTAYLRAGLVPEPFRSETRKHLLEYIEIRVGHYKGNASKDYAISRSHELLDSLWSFAEALNAQDRSSEAYSLYTDTINSLVDNFNQRITVTLEYRIPPAIIGILFVMLFLAMLILGYQFGISGKGGLGLNLMLATLFAVVMFLIFALDRPDTGLIRLNQQPLLTLDQQLRERSGR